MDRGGTIKLDNAVFAGRLRMPPMPAGHMHRPTPRPERRVVSDIYQPRFKSYRLASQPPEKSTWSAPVALAGSKMFPLAAPYPEPSQNSLPAEPAWPPVVKETQTVPPTIKAASRWRLSNFKPALPYAMAAVVFIIGLYVSFSGFKTNNVAQAQINKISQQSTKSSPAAGDAPPITVKPTPAQITSYNVAPSLPRYIDIPFIGVHARVLQTTTKADGSLGTPNNVFDTAWYSSSSKPGDPGAMLIDGHISSWTTKGVFYNLNQVIKGNLINITRGDDKIFSYKVVKTEIVAASKVNMADLLVSQTTAKPGLNLISCTGDVIPGTNDFDKRIVIFAVLQ